MNFKIFNIYNDTKLEILSFLFKLFGLRYL